MFLEFQQQTGSRGGTLNVEIVLPPTLLSSSTQSERGLEPPWRISSFSTPFFSVVCKRECSPDKFKHWQNNGCFQRQFKSQAPFPVGDETVVNAAAHRFGGNLLQNMVLCLHGDIKLKLSNNGHQLYHVLHHNKITNMHWSSNGHIFQRFKYKYSI